MIKDIQDYEFGVKWLFDYVYSSPSISFEELTDGQIEAIREFGPRMPADEFPEDFPAEDGYTGDYHDLYRGYFFLKEEEYQEFMNSIKDGILHLNSISSWTTHPNVAERFANGAGYYSYNKEADVKGFKGIVLKIEKVFPPSIFFSSYEASGSFEDYYSEELTERENEKQHHIHEEEMVLLPGSFNVRIEKVIDII
ncbi:hypothetical protein [Niallia taxi]|uniref:hypothetical protein n=1 Tax=Niallia taxi TaxID=2499688 RepID=UPI0015F457AE|nr:hypothetical protein [Niallia taxi]